MTSVLRTSGVCVLSLCCLEDECLILILFSVNHLFIDALNRLNTDSRFFALKDTSPAPALSHCVRARALFSSPSPVLPPSAPLPAVPCKRFSSGLPWVLFFPRNIFEHYFEQKGTGQLMFMAACRRPRSPLCPWRTPLPLSGSHFPFAASSIINSFLSFH